MEIFLEYFFWVWYKFIGLTECHQMVERTLTFDEKLLFICCRCSGVYTGYFISYFFIWFSGKRNARGFPPGKVILLGSVLSLLMFVDVGTAFFELRTGSNDIRVITGLLAGFSFTFLAIPLVNRLSFDRIDNNRVLDGIKQYLYVLAIIIVTFMLMRSGLAFLFWPFFIVISINLILLYINVNSILILLFLRLLKVKLRTCYVIVIAFIMSFIEKFTLYKVFFD